MSGGFLLDEHLPLWWRKEILRREPSLQIWRVGDPSTLSLGTPDKEILEWCEVNDFYLITNNRSTMPIHLADHLSQGRHCPGIFQIDPGMTIDELTDELILIEGASLVGEFQDQINYLPLV